MTTYTLDISKWRCGGNGPLSLGRGATEMLNDEGYMCCLGQFSGQHPSALRGNATPSTVARSLDSAYDPLFVEDRRLDEFERGYYNTELSRALWGVNDLESTTPAEKVEQIRANLAAHGHDLEVVDPDGILEGEA